MVKLRTGDLGKVMNVGWSQVPSTLQVDRDHSNHAAERQRYPPCSLLQLTSSL